ncbi:hypothetical protein HMPREF3190_00684 [Umbribacter vaginalis]|nr:hypothetical protein HMPREF3190_00684 [Coriobacteriales bacterium DNF00809]
MLSGTFKQLTFVPAYHQIHVLCVHVLNCAHLCKKICIMLQLQHLFSLKAFILLNEDNK